MRATVSQKALLLIYLMPDLLSSAISLHSDPDLDIRILDIQVNAVATALKQFFNDLPDPVVPSNLYDELFEAAGQ